jgi:hypothetical protein
MNAVERLEAAIVKLEQLNAESTPGPWQWWNLERADRGWTGNGPTLETVARDDLDPECAKAGVIVAWGHDAWGLDVEPADADLIVTLHRTIDAQLAILRTALVIVTPEPGFLHSYDAGPGSQVGNALALADAILGGDA